MLRDVRSRGTKDDGIRRLPSPSSAFRDSFTRHGAVLVLGFSDCVSSGRYVESGRGIVKRRHFCGNSVQVHSFSQNRMPKKSPHLEAKESQIVAWYKWEFLRRNVEYRKDYEEFIQEFGGWFEKRGYWYDETKEDWGPDNLQFFATVIAPKAKAICERWQTRDLFSPDWDFTLSGAYYYRPGWEVSLPTDCSKEEAGQAVDLSKFYLSEEEFRKSLQRRGRAPEHQLVLKFDLRRSLVSLLRQAREQISSRKAQYDRRHPQPAKIAPAVRRRLDYYKVYLEVWDRRSRYREKYLSIGVEMFGSGPSRLLKNYSRSTSESC